MGIVVLETVLVSFFIIPNNALIGDIDLILPIQKKLYDI